MSELLIALLFLAILIPGAVSWLFFSRFSQSAIEASIVIGISEAALALLSMVVSPLLLLALSYQLNGQQYPTGHDWFIPIAGCAGWVAWQIAKKTQKGGSA